MKKNCSYLVKRWYENSDPLKITCLDETHTCYKILFDGGYAYYMEKAVFEDRFRIIEVLGDEPLAATESLNTPSSATTSLRKSQAAARLGISVQTLDRWVKNQEIPFTRLGKFVLFNPSDIEEFMEGKLNNNKNTKQ